MSTTYITIQQFCTFHRCEAVIVEDFVDHGIVETHHENDARVIPGAQVARLERALRLYTELGVNAAGIDIILNLLDRLETDRFTAIEDL